MFATARRPLLATVGYIIFVFGQVFDAAVVPPNKLDLGGTEGDMPVIASWSSTAAWCSGLLCASTLVAIKQWTQSWLPLLLTPLVMRIAGTTAYIRYCSMRPAREYLSTVPGERRSYLLAQESKPR
eukprot:SAG31_NODE_1329_length_8753_cov_4.101225_7_plen_126_part_00